MSWSFRLAEKKDAASFAEWAAYNTQVDEADLLAGTKSKNPTVLFVVAEKDGVAVAFAPVYLSATVAHLGFDPNADGRDKLRAMQMLIDGTSALMVQFGVHEITTLSKMEYPVAKWALKHGFDADARQTFRLDLNKQMAKAV